MLEATMEPSHHSLPTDSPEMKEGPAKNAENERTYIQENARENGMTVDGRSDWEEGRIVKRRIQI
jgi:hypothetical protein